MNIWKRSLALFALLAVLALNLYAPAAAQDPGPLSPDATITGDFIYQGQLYRSGAPVNAECEFRFELFSSPTQGMGYQIINATLPVSQGRFTANLTWPTSVWNGSERYVSTEVMCAGDTSYTVLPPQEVTPVPYAIYSLSSGALHGRAVSNAAPAAGQVLTWSGSTWAPAGLSQTAWLLGGNSGTTPGTHFIGTKDNKALELRVNNARVMQFVPDATIPILLGGHTSNSITPGASGGLLLWGGTAEFPNRVTDIMSIVVGGSGNQAGNSNAVVDDGKYSFVGGGGGNRAGGVSSVVVGGNSNIADAQFSAALTGVSNEVTAASESSVIAGGFNNRISGRWGTIPGGYENEVLGDYSLAAGYEASAVSNGSFVWADYSPTDPAFGSLFMPANSFLVRAHGGLGYNTSEPYANTVTVQGQVVAGNAPFLPSGAGESFIASGATSGISMSDRTSFDTYGRWVIYPNTGVLRFWKGGDKMTLDADGNLWTAGSVSLLCPEGSAPDGACNMDFAEAFASLEPTEAGDLLALAAGKDGHPAVVKASQAYDPNLIGVVSANPGLLFRNGETHLGGDNSRFQSDSEALVALSGRVLVKVSVENGIIVIGDGLTSAGQPGVAMKATQTGKIIGYALEATEVDGQILALIQPGYYVAEEAIPAQATSTKNAELQAQVEQLEARLTEQNVRLTEQNARLTEQSVRLERLEAQLENSGFGTGALQGSAWPLLVGGLLVGGLGAGWLGRKRGQP